MPVMISEGRVQNDGRSTRYLEAGAGWPVLLIHAFPLSADMWRPQLERVPDGWRYIAADLRGFGGSPPSPGGSPSIDDFADDLEALLDALELERAVIGGISMGGYVTFALFRKSPDRFSGMILANTRPQADSAEGRQARRALAELLHKQGPSGVATQMVPKLLGETSRRLQPDLEAHVRLMIEANSIEGLDGAIQAMLNRPDSGPDLARIACPALLIAGEEDELTPVADSERMTAAISRSHLVVLPRIGHLSSVEAPDDFSQILEDFLTSNR